MYCNNCKSLVEEGWNFCRQCGTQLDGNDSGPIEDLAFPATLPQRLVNFLIDALAAPIIAYILGFMAISILDKSLGILVGIFAFFAYHFVFEATDQQTLGKVITGTKVVTLNGDKPSLKQLAIRTMARYIPYEFISFVIDGYYPRSGWHDKVSNTLVVPKHLSPEQVKNMVNAERLNKTESKLKPFMWTFIVLSALTVLTVTFTFVAIVSASIRKATDKSDDIALKTDLLEAQNQAAKYYIENSNSYDGICSVDSVRNLLVKQGATCIEHVMGFVLYAPLNAGGHQCVDGLGNEEVITQKISAYDTKLSCLNLPSDGVSDSSDQFKESLQKVELINSIIKFPVQLDDVTRFDGIELKEDNKIHLKATFLDFDSLGANWSELEKPLHAELLKASCETDSSWFSFKDNENVVFVWDYFKSNGTFLGSIEISIKDCTYTEAKFTN